MFYTTQQTQKTNIALMFRNFFNILLIEFKWLNPWRFNTELYLWVL